MTMDAAARAQVVEVLAELLLDDLDREDAEEPAEAMAEASHG